MVVDVRELPDGHERRCDVCVIGGGVAGITLAREFAAHAHQIVLVESGGLLPDSSVQDLYSGDYHAHDVYDLRSSRLRYFGGTSNHWSGNCMQLEAHDFQARDWVPGSGWPISFDELVPYYQRAASVCEVPGGHFDAAGWARNSNPLATSFDAERFLHRIAQQSPPTRFGVRYRETLDRAESVTVHLNANVVDLRIFERGQAVQAAVVKTLQGATYTIYARVFVLACGAIENARLLLNCTAATPSGIGNQHGLVGRYFMDHPTVYAGTALTGKSFSDREFFQVRRSDEGARIRGLLRLSPAVQHQYRTGSAFLILGAAVEPLAWTRRSLGAIVRALQQGRVHGLLWHQIQEAWQGLGDALTAWRRPEPGDYETHSVLLWSEQAPNPDSRVALTNERDALGLRRVRVDWRLSEFDRRTIDKTLQLFAAEMGRLGLGRVRSELGDDPIWPEKMRGGPHHMGTTRMHDDPKRGVVDRDCRVHGMHNLYIAGSSVFPTSGSSMPTLTIVALALRLADCIKEQARKWH